MDAPSSDIIPRSSVVSPVAQAPSISTSYLDDVIVAEEDIETTSPCASIPTESVDVIEESPEEGGLGSVDAPQSAGVSPSKIRDESVVVEDVKDGDEDEGYEVVDGSDSARVAETVGDEVVTAETVGDIVKASELTEEDADEMLNIAKSMLYSDPSGAVLVCCKVLDVFPESKRASVIHKLAGEFMCLIMTSLSLSYVTKF